MGTFGYSDGIAVLQVIVFPIVFVTSLLIWRRVGWREGGKSWRFVATLSLLRIAGSICTFLRINNNSERIFIAEAVCELIGIAPLLLTYIGILGQIDTYEAINPRHLRLITLLGFLGLILGIVGVSIMDTNTVFHANSEMKAAMGIFLAVFALVTYFTGWLVLQLWFTIRTWQKKLFLAIFLSWPFLLIRLVYSAVGDFDGTDKRFVIGGDNTIYLCMDVLEEIVAMALCVGFGLSAVVSKEREELVAVAETWTTIDPKIQGQV